MSYILFCKGKIAEIPYRVADLHKKLYTIEELCYYIYNNTSICGEELMKSQLVHWIDQYCGLTDLSESIRTVKRNEGGPERVASLIFSYTGYLTKSEREAVCEKIRKYSLLGINERKKVRADSLYMEGCYHDAIRDYEEMLIGEYYDHEKIRHNIIYNIGCCYAAMFYYQIAFDWFMKAAECGTDKGNDWLAALFCKKMMLTDREYRDFLEANPEFDKLSSILSKELDETTKLLAAEPSMVKLEEYRGGKRGHNDEYKQYVAGVIAEYKTEI